MQLSEVIETVGVDIENDVIPVKGALRGAVGASERLITGSAGANGGIERSGTHPQLLNSVAASGRDFSSSQHQAGLNGGIETPAKPTR